MTNQEFIEKAYSNINNDGSYSGKHQNLFSEGNTIYSYGYHYPLLFKIDGFWFRNTAGYSSTTSKHIAYSYFSGVIDVELPSGSARDINTIINVLEKQRDAVRDTMDGKKRKDTQVYRGLERD